MTQNKPAVNPPLWLLAELTYRCPLQCPYCSNPLDFAQQEKELTTEQWIEVFRQARAMGSVQLGFSGGEPLTRKYLPELIRAARDLSFYTNLITSGIGLTEKKLDAFADAGLDHIQISFQASDETLNTALAGSKKAFQQELEMARAVKKHGYPMVLNLVLHSHNIDQIDKIIDLCIELEADDVELATCQFYGWAQLPSGSEAWLASLTDAVRLSGNSANAPPPDDVAIRELLRQLPQALSASADTGRWLPAVVRHGSAHAQRR